MAAMKLIGDESIFTSLKQDGIFSTKDSVPFPHPFSSEVKEWVKTFCHERTDVTRYRSVRNQIFDFLNIGSFSEIEGLIGPAPSGGITPSPSTLIVKAQHNEGIINFTMPVQKGLTWSVDESGTLSSVNVYWIELGQ